jgi:hypothetical protein
MTMAANLDVIAAIPIFSRTPFFRSDLSIPAGLHTGGGTFAPRQGILSK